MSNYCHLPGEPGGRPRPLRTLIVDDSAQLREGLCDLLDNEPLVRVVGTATDGCEALQKAALLAPDLVLMDLHMPVMDGLQATVQLRCRLPNARIIIMTLAERILAEAEAKQHGAHGFVEKGLLAKTLMTEIRRVCGLEPVKQ